MKWNGFSVGRQQLLILLDEGQDRRQGGRRYLAPQFSKNRRNREHPNILRPLEDRASSGRERLQIIELIGLPVTRR